MPKVKNFENRSFDFNVGLIPQDYDYYDEDSNECLTLKVSEVKLLEMTEIFPEYSVEDIVVHWYNSLDETKDNNLGAENIVFSYNKETNKYNVTFDFEIVEYDDGRSINSQYTDEGEFIFRRLIDPDDDGNYPIKINGVVYLIMGEEIDI
jgi:hypothetical protein